jgi:hypothetical protein
MLLGERHHDIGVRRAHRRRIAVDGIDAAVGQPDLVQDTEQLIVRNLAADGLLHQIADARRLFDAGPGFGAQMQLELAGVGGREEILPEPGIKQECGEAGQQEKRHEHPPPMHQHAQDGVIAVAQAVECRSKVLCSSTSGLRLGP